MKERHAQGSDPGIRGNPGNPGNPGSGTRIHERHSLLLGLRQGPPQKIRENPGHMRFALTGVGNTHPAVLGQHRVYHNL